MRPVVRFTDNTDGSFALGEPGHLLAERRATVTDGRPVTWLTQVHGADVVEVTRPGDGVGATADAAITTTADVALAVITADCAPVILTSAGAVGAVHAGWRGLVAGVLPATVRAMRARGAGPITAWLGPCIRGRCYEFGPADLDVAAATLGDGVRSTTAWGTPAFDVTAAVAASLRSVGVDRPVDAGVCTACSPVHYSHRARAETGRQAAFVWLDPEPADPAIGSRSRAADG